MSLQPSDLHVFAARSNPLHWNTPHENYFQFAAAMNRAGVSLTVIECAFGEEDFTCQMSGVRHIGVRAKSRVWSKECLLNLAIQRTPEARYIAWIDADVLFRRSDWAVATLHGLQHYDILQPWENAYDLGPKGEHMAVHNSFCRQWFEGQPVVPHGPKPWKHNGSPYDYPHSGYAWAITRQAYDWVGGLFEVGGMGSGDHHMALSLVGAADYSMPGGTNGVYRDEVKRWEARAIRHINYNIGYVRGTVEHLFHGRKEDRGYQSRWGIFVKHGFNPHTDLKRNSHGVLEWAGNKPELKRDFDRYLQSRNEDINSL
jgi:hypothetical protein